MSRSFAAGLLDVDMLGPTFGFVAIKNLGPGTALHVDLVLNFDPLGQAMAWNEPVFVPGELHHFFMPEQIR